MIRPCEWKPNMPKKKIRKVYDALVEGAYQGLSDVELHDYVFEQCPKATSKRLVRAALLALSDPHVQDRNVLNVIYALAIKHRLDGGPDSDDDDE
tara:strand:- start:9465 stop:9749 length:285 start_codon:yes stop_codon:yes gene_type:complete